MGISVDNVSKRLGSTQALDGLSLEVPRGTVLGLLGPNGAGKTTTVSILATLLRPDSGQARVCGIDVDAAPREVRRLIALTGQFVALDDQLTGRENVEMIGQLLRLRRREARRRGAALLEQFGLAGDADRKLSTYSGGMRRRLDLAVSLVGRPRVLFLDEPTTGLDLRSRLDLWSAITDLAREGTTVLLTTQYLEEADRLADQIVLIDHGRLVAEGKPDDLKAKVGRERVSLHLADPATVDEAVALLRPHAAGEPSRDDEAAEVSAQLSGGVSQLPAVLRQLDDAAVGIVNVAVRRPTLDDVFLALTGRPAAERADGEPSKSPA